MFKVSFGNASKFTSLKWKHKEIISSANNGEPKVIGLDNIELSSTFVIHKVLLVKSMKFHLLSVSEIFGIEYEVEFHLIKCLVKHNELGITILVRQRKDNIYPINLSYATNPSY